MGCDTSGESPYFSKPVTVPGFESGGGHRFWVGWPGGLFLKNLAVAYQITPSAIATKPRHHAVGSTKMLEMRNSAGLLRPTLASIAVGRCAAEALRGL